MNSVLNTGSFRNIDFFDSIEILKLCGIKNIELNLRPVIDENIPKEKIKTVLDSGGFEISNLAGGWCDFFVNGKDFNKTLISLERQIKLCEYFGNNKLRVFFGLLPEKYTTEEHYSNLLKNSMKISEEHKDIDFMFENHDYNSVNPDFLSCFFKDTNSRNISLTFDPVNFHRAGVDWLSAFQVLHPFIKHVHIKGFKDGKIYSYRKSELDLSAMFALLMKINYKEFISLEYEAGGDVISNTILDFIQLNNDLKNFKGKK